MMSKHGLMLLLWGGLSGPALAQTVCANPSFCTQNLFAAASAPAAQPAAAQQDASAKKLGEDVQVAAPSQAVFAAAPAKPAPMQITLRKPVSGSLKTAKTPAAHNQARAKMPIKEARVHFVAPKPVAPVSIAQSRKRTLNRELASERAALQRTRLQLSRANPNQSFNLRQAVSDHEASIKALQREMKQL